jgi:hypothetical protein
MIIELIELAFIDFHSVWVSCNGETFAGGQFGKRREKGMTRLKGTHNLWIPSAIPQIKVNLGSLKRT